MERIVAIMAGGTGERFWPLSRRSLPKQLLRLNDPERTMLTETIDRVSPVVGDENIYLCVAPHLVDLIAENTPQIPADRILCEPVRRDTAGGIAWLVANLLARGYDPTQTSLAVLASDHRIAPDAVFADTVRAAYTHAEETGDLVTMGIKPTRPATGYGYIECDRASSPRVVQGQTVRNVVAFREKPALPQAQEFLRSGRFLWNSGMFFWTLEALLRELAHGSPSHHAAVLRIAELLAADRQADAVTAFSELGSVSIDYALMEKSDRVAVVEALFEWDDLGSWDSLARYRPLDENGNVSPEDAILEDTEECVVYQAKVGQRVCMAGVQNLIVVVTADAILISSKRNPDLVKRIVRRLADEQSSLL
jgi:mannose-1-phosphate guanylyltransferase